MVLPEIPEAPDPFAFVKEDSGEIDDSDIPLDPVMEDDEPPASKKKKKGQKKRLPRRLLKYRKRTIKN